MESSLVSPPAESAIPRRQSPVDVTARSILVFGATGLIGRPVTEQLVDAGFDVRVFARDLARARSLLPETCTFVRGDLRDPSSIEEALEGVDAAYLSLSNQMVTSRPAWDSDTEGALAVLEAARNVGVNRLLRLSAMGVDRDSAWWVARTKKEVDDAFLSSGLDCTIFRPTWFMESLALCCVGPVIVPFAAPDDPLYWIAAEDYGRQVVAALRRPDTAGTAYDVQGPECMSMRDASRRFARVWRKSLFLSPLPMPRLLLRLGRSVGPLNYLDRLLDMTYEHCVKYPAEVNAHDLHRPMVTIEEFAEGLLTSTRFPSKKV